uniref:NADH-ubiquinone oxidoreductase chain 4L n=2 Tax=Ledra TaxID=1310350 RepID=A0A6B9QE48_9HEMI|nr:NADH dehydrogenase subunit 4L [Ledra auditura]UGK73317.1 NADH dehydrogenase subunit 4L [Ledra trigona]
MMITSMYSYMMTTVSMMIMRKHTLMSLLSLEFMMMSIMMLTMILCLKMKFSMYMFVFIMTFMVCEGVLGLSTLVNMIRCQGNDFMNSSFSW